MVMTTNYPESLDPALMRPGRADVRIDFKLASLDQIEEMFLRFFPESPPGEAEGFSEAIGEGKKSPAEVQALLLKLAGDRI
jgi:chaperone BCS1